MLGALALAGASLVGCTSSPKDSELTIRSADKPGALTPAMQTAVYRRYDENSADLYLTDLPLARLADPADKLEDASGNLLHVHLFLIPYAGRTPVDSTACNVTIRHIIVSGGAVGVYGGGGFMYASGRTGDSVFGGIMQGASLRLVRATPDFQDLLGPALLDGTIKAGLDERGAVTLAERVDQLCARAKPVAPPKSVPPAPAAAAPVSSDGPGQ